MLNFLKRLTDHGRLLVGLSMASNVHKRHLDQSVFKANRANWRKINSISVCFAIISCIMWSCSEQNGSPGNQTVRPATASPDGLAPVQLGGASGSDPQIDGDMVVMDLAPALQPIALHIRHRHLELARDRLHRHLRQYPEDPQAIFLVGLTFHREQKYGQALPHYEKALSLKPLYAPINHFRGWALYYLGELAQSRGAFLEFLKVMPDEPDSHFALGLIALDEHDLDRSEKLLQRSIDLWMTKEHQPDPASIAKAHARLSEVFEQRGDLVSARDHLQKAVDLYPDHYEAMYKLYRVLVRLGEQEHANRMHERYVTTKERVRPGTSFPE